MKKSFLFLLFLLLFLFNLKFLSRFYDWDTVAYAYNIHTGLLKRVFFNPHHLAFESTGYLFYKLWIFFFGNEFDIMFILRMRVLLFSYVFLYILVFFHYKIYKDFIGSILIALCIHFLQSFWFYSHHHDTPLIHSCLVIILVLYSIYCSKFGLNQNKIFFFFFLQIATIYFHQSNVIFLSLFPLTIFLLKKYQNQYFSLPKKLRIIFIYLFVLSILIILSYFFVGFFVLKRNFNASLNSEKNFSNWIFLYLAQEKWGNFNEKKDYILYFYRGIGDAFLTFKDFRASLRINFFDFYNPKHLPYNINLIYWIFIFFLFILNFKSFYKKYKSEFYIYIFFLVPSILFYTWWEGYYFEFWVGTSIGLVLFSYLVFRSLEFSIFKRFLRSIFHSILFLYTFFLFVVNFTFSQYPRSLKQKIGYIVGMEKKMKAIDAEKIYYDRKKYKIPKKKKSKLDE